jgi:hypothetical protein
MSYLHCPSCKRAYNIATSPVCPSCPVAATLVDPAEDIVAATEQLARAMARATPDERSDAMARMDRLALPAPGARPTTFHGAMVKSIREALVPSPPPPRMRKRQLLLAELSGIAPRATGMLARLADKLAPRVAQATSRMYQLVHAAADPS